MSSELHSERQWRGMAAVRRSAKVMKRFITGVTSAFFLCYSTTLLTAGPQEAASAIKHSEMTECDGRDLLQRRTYLEVGPAQMEWSLNSTTHKTGWVYFKKPQSKDLIWEFAPCSRTNLHDVAAEDLRVEFIRVGDPRVESLFRPSQPPERPISNMPPPTGIRVREGDIVLARLIKSPAAVYAVKFTEQGGTENAGSIRIDYVELK